MSTSQVSLDIVPGFLPLYESVYDEKIRNIFMWGGRGGAKSMAMADFLAVMGAQETAKYLNARQVQLSIKDSVHSLIKERIRQNQIKGYSITDKSINNRRTKTSMIFRGLSKQTEDSIKSLFQVLRCWVEEAQSITNQSLKILTPTIRAPNSKLYWTYNRHNADDPVHEYFLSHRTKKEKMRYTAPDGKQYYWHLHRGDGCIGIEINYDGNPYFPQVLEDERKKAQRTMPVEEYMHIWEGGCRIIGDAIIFNGKFEVKEFDTPSTVEIFENRFFYGADWGFAKDPTVMTRCFIKDQCLYVEYEAHGYHVELDDIPALFDQIPESRKWPSYGDNSRPETISYVARSGFNISAADKWPGSVEDGITYMKSFKKIYIHPRCTNTLFECKHYCYKTDPNTDEILPIIVDKHNHCMDSIRYGLSPYITRQTSILDVI